MGNHSLWISVLLKSLFHLHNAREQRVVCCYFNLRVCVVLANRLGSESRVVASLIVGAQGVFIRTDSSSNTSPVSGSQCCRFQIACPSAAALSIWQHGPTHRPAPRSVLGESQLGSSNRLLVQKALATNLGFWRTIDASTHGSFRSAAHPSRICVRLQPTHAAVANDQVHYPDSSRMVP